MRTGHQAHREFAKARGYELQRSHGAGVGAAYAQRIESLFAREQQELAEFLAEETRSRRVIKAQGGERVHDAIAAGGAAVLSLHPQHRDQVFRRHLVLERDLIEQLLVLVPELNSGVDARLREHAGTVLPPLQRFLGRPAHRVDDLGLRLGRAEHRG